MTAERIYTKPAPERLTFKSLVVGDSFIFKHEDHGKTPCLKMGPEQIMGLEGRWASVERLVPHLYTAEVIRVNLNIQWEPVPV